MDILPYILSRAYVNEVMIGGGALKGKNCTIESITELEKEMEVVFKWTLDDGTVKKESMKVPKGSGSGAEAFIFTFNFEPNGSENPISNLSATYDEIKAAIDGGMTVYGVSTISGYMYMQFTPTVWMDGMLLFSADNPDGGLPYQLMIESSGNGVVRTGELEENVFSVSVYTGVLEDGTRFIDFDCSYDDINNAFSRMKAVVCKLNVTEQDGTRYDVSLYTRSRADGMIVFSGKAAPQGVENEYTLTIKYTGEKTLIVEETDEKLRKAVQTANDYTDEQIEKISIAEVLSVAEKPLYNEDGTITYIKDGVTQTLEKGYVWFYYYDADGVLLQTIWIDGTEYTLKAGNVDLKEYLKKTSVVMPKENISDPDPEYKAEDVPSMALLEKLLAENGGGGITGGNPVGTVIAFSGLIPPDGYLLCDGAEVKREEYADLFSVIGEIYGSGDGSTTFNLPNLTDKFVQGVGANTLGTTMEAGLPNINGRWDAVNLQGSSNSGAVYTSRRDDGAAKEGSGAGFGEDTYYFNASRSSAIYGKSTTVQPPAVVMTYIIRAVAGEAVQENDYVAGDGISIEPTTVDGREAFAISCTQGFNITGQLRGSSEIVSLDKTFAEIKAAIEAEKNVTLYIFAEGETENPYVFTPSVILADTINFSLVYGVNVIDTFMLMSVDINSDDTYTINSKIMQKELVAGEGIEIEPKTTEDGKDVLAIKSTRNFERRQAMPTGADDDPIRPDFLYVDETNGATDEEAALLKRYVPDLSNAGDGYLRYMPVDSFIKPIDTMTLLTELTITPPAPQAFVIADSLLYLQGYFKSSQTFSSTGWHSVCKCDLANIGYEWAGLEEGEPIRTLVSVWLDGAYVNSAISVYHLTDSPSQVNFAFYVTSALVNKAIAFNLNVMLPVRKKR